MIDESRVVELKPGSDPVMLCVFNRPFARLMFVTEEDYQSERRLQPVAMPEGGDQLVKLDNHAWRLALAEAEDRKLPVGVVVSEWVRKMKENG